MKGVIWCPQKEKEKKKPAQLPSGLILGRWVCVPAPSCLLAGNLLFRRATRLGFSLSLSRSCSFSSASLALAGAGWSSADFWELMRKEERTETRFLLLSTLQQLCCAFHKLSCVVCEAQKKKKRRKKQTNKQKKNALRLIAIAGFSSTSSSSSFSQRETEWDRLKLPERHSEREREREREYTVPSFLLWSSSSSSCCIKLLVLDLQLLPTNAISDHQQRAYCCTIRACSFY